LPRSLLPPFSTDPALVGIGHGLEQLADRDLPIESLGLPVETILEAFRPTVTTITPLKPPPPEASTDLLAFNHYIDPDYLSPRHIQYLRDALNEVERYIESGGREGIGRLIVTMPPRTGKSLTGSKRWPSYLLGRHPKWRIAIVAYNDSFAEDFSRAARSLIKESAEYHAVFPNAIIRPDSDSLHRWALKERGPDDPSMVVAGMDGSLTGRGFHLILLDDPIKNRAEAESKANRDHILAAYQGTIRTRLEPGGAIVIFVTRWHEDDLPGKLAELEKAGGGEHFTVINLPALAEAGDPLGRDVGAPLWADRYPKDEMLLTKLAVGDYEWESQYQGHPKPPKGGKIQRNWFTVLPQLPDRFRSIGGAPPAEKLVWYRYWDLAVETSTRNDFTASARIAFDDEENLYIADMIRDRWEWPDQKAEMKKTMLIEKALGVRHGVEKALHGAAAVQEFRRDPDLRGVIFEGIDVESDKLTRALPWIGRASAGKVFLIMGGWVTVFLDEGSNFTGHNDAHDDQIDTISGGVAMSEGGGSAQRLLDFYKRKAEEAKRAAEKKEGEESNSTKEKIA